MDFFIWKPKELFETQGTFSENLRNIAENHRNFLKPQELKPDGTFLEHQKKRWSLSIGFWMYKKHTDAWF